MKLNLLLKKNIKDLNFDLNKLLYEKFNIRMRKFSNQSKTHLIKKISKDIARIKTLLSIKAQKKNKDFNNEDNK